MTATTRDAFDDVFDDLKRCYRLASVLQTLAIVGTVYLLLPDRPRPQPCEPGPTSTRQPLDLDRTRP